MAIYPKTETRRAKRRNGAAYQHRRLRSLTGGLSVITHGRRMEYQRSHSMFLTHWIAETVGTSWSDRASLAPETGRKRRLSRKQKGEYGGRENRARVEPSTRVFCPTPIAPKTQTPRPHPRRPGTSPTSAPTSARDPLNTLFRSVRTYSQSEIPQESTSGKVGDGAPIAPITNLLARD
jgi:hypothetical protein